MADAKKKDELSDIEAAIEEIMAGEDVSVEDEAEPESESSGIDIEIEALIAERDAFRDKFMRALADAENSRKRSERDRREAENYGGSKLARDMLPVYDNMKRALDVVNDDLRGQAAGLIEGLELTMRELLNIFEKHGISKITPAVGDKFDPQLHEAMFEAPVPGTKAGQIIQVMGEGFLLHERLLRPAQVGVSSNPG
ncbi:nucleotide exchange factor GrpE [Maritimibacter sp. HL-12]|uniref:nucleotide exchange factor GrpE n=1 Tax=Maritimibacter sp. HL-12 TaxID=1162418 RepID=UPI000A0EF441|nr:nucleotide exchange factor GrpE [Maritimibacter sp. HL-12]SMH44930.1 molecular chaperone GrpE [Maritimibacter sp. HL-12]